MNEKRIFLIGAALGWGAQKIETELGPKALKDFGLEKKLKESGLDCTWLPFISPPTTFEQVGKQPFSKRLPWIVDVDETLAATTAQTMQQGLPVILGGDHSIAVGTWTGVVQALQAQQDFGLIWFDAHMDAHTPETTPSQAIHGMPVASLLGHGHEALVNLGLPGAKIKPEHLVLIGIRSYESAEANFLQSLGVKIYFMDEIVERGLDTVCQEALAKVKHTKGFGITIDLDGFDPEVAPGVGSPEKNGLLPQSFLPAFHQLVQDPDFKALEIAEYNPTLDPNRKTAELTLDILKQLGAT